MEDMYCGEDSHASKSADSSSGNDTSVYEESGSGANCTLELHDVRGENRLTTSSSCLEKNSICDSAGLFPKVQTIQSGFGLYREDIVQCTEHKGLIGMVMKLADDSDSDSASSDSEDQDEDESIPEDCARIVWTDLSETTEKINDIEVLDRVFVHGDFVAAASDPSGQIGIVVNVDLTVDLLTPTSDTIRNVSSRNLHRIRAFELDDYVIHGPWLGRVDEVVDNVTVIFDDGSKCKLMKADPDLLIPISHNLHYPYFPGQRVRAKSSTVFKKARWLWGKWKSNIMEGTVCNVEVGSVSVHWIAAANRCYNFQSTIIPPREQNPKQLKLLSYFSYANWELGDRCLLPASERRTSEVTLPVTDDIVSHRRARRKDNVLEEALFLGNKRTRVDVIWQDGTRTYGVESRTLTPIDDLGDHDFFPEQYVLDKGSEDDGEASEAGRVGIVKSVDSKERTARVRWLKAVGCPEDTGKFDGEELVSVYELAEHPDYDCFVGDIVIRLSPVSGEREVPGIVNQLGGQIECRDETGRKNVVETTDLSTNKKGLKKTQKADLDKSLEESNLSWIGNVIGVEDGDIEVAWADGTVSKVGPQQISVVNDEEDDTEEDDEEDITEDDDEDDTDDSASWETAEEDDEDDKDEEDDSASWETAEEDDKDDSASWETAKDEEDDGKIEMEQTKDDYIVHSLSSSGCHDPGQFKHFDNVKEPTDHFYQNEKGQPINERKWLKKVQQEWNILEKDLPDTIFVRIYEDRMDLLRAVIVGASGTPYHDGLFFFDFHFPSEYPNIPPLAYYHSGGLRLNPNLYENGKVCLSLLNTWTGKGNEVWNPSSSNVLQVLVSIQGLVLNAKPYFNEPGYDKQIGSAEGEKNSLAYKENSFLLSCKSMLYILRRPPKHFEMFVKEHFQKRGHCILRACDAYMKGAQVGSLSEDCTLPSNGGVESQNQSTSSAGFKLILLKIVPKLILAFSEIGVDCQEFQHLTTKESRL